LILVAGNLHYPSLLEQLNNHFETRTKIDRVWAEVLGWEGYLPDKEGEQGEDAVDRYEEIEKLQDQIGGFLHELQMLMGNN